MRGDGAIGFGDGDTVCSCVCVCVSDGIVDLAEVEKEEVMAQMMAMVGVLKLGSWTQQLMKSCMEMIVLEYDRIQRQY